jgi:hypothetical protein
MNKNLELQNDLPEFKKNAWMYSFMDLVLLLICFFIMMFAATRHVSRDADKVFESVREKFSAKIQYIENQGINVIYDTISSHIQHSNLSPYFDLSKDDKKVSIIIPHKFLFKEGSVTEEANKIADFLSNTLFNITKNRIEIENQIDIDSALKANSGIEDKIEESTKIAIKIQSLLREKGIRSSLFIRNIFRPINYKNSNSISSAVSINIYSEHS